MKLNKRRSREAAHVNRDDIRDWLVAELAKRTGVVDREVDTSKPFESYGLDSTSAVQMSGKLERFVGHQISPGVLFDYPTIDKLADFLANPAENVQI